MAFELQLGTSAETILETIKIGEKDISLESMIVHQDGQQQRVVIQGGGDDRDEVMKWQDMKHKQRQEMNVEHLLAPAEVEEDSVVAKAHQADQADEENAGVDEDEQLVVVDHLEAQHRWLAFLILVDGQEG